MLVWCGERSTKTKGAVARAWPEAVSRAQALGRRIEVFRVEGYG